MNKLIGIVMVGCILVVYSVVRWQDASHEALFDAPGYSLEVIRGDGERLTDRDVAGKTVVMNFWATWCKICQKETPYLQQIYGHLPSESVKMVGVASFDDGERVKSSTKLDQVPYDIALDADGSIAQAFGIHALPQTVVIGPDGKVLYRVRGQVKDAEVVAIRQMLQGKRI